ncbi:hypothetical protein BDV36DRAFT_287932 [Aspergillus pseudocaelatus]|uniref:Protein kinase domain-containing protein n=1 Tax=Aspergillus pseudocaelatus TaxID=1825620 RepID=A0ABQ6W5T1_9EURO|nr:hypothetical protein BDV36DRAFT_287932 [Aspergillus pseudocaelatus]
MRLDLNDFAFISCEKEFEISSYNTIEKHLWYSNYREIDLFIYKGTAYTWVVPDFYRRPYLYRFLKDKLDFAIYTEDRAAALLEIIYKIYNTGFCHGDLYSRNIESLINRQHNWMEDDTIMASELLGLLAKNMKLGRLVHAWGYYYHYS